MKAWPVVPLADVLRHRKEFITIDDIQHYKRCRVQLHAKGVLLRDSVSGADIKRLYSRNSVMSHSGNRQISTESER